MFDLVKTVEQLNAWEREDRLEAVRELRAAINRGDIPAVERIGESFRRLALKFV